MYIFTEPSTAFTAAAILLCAALLHASFQLSVSVMTLLSGHTLGFKRSHGRLLHLCASYIGGNAMIIALLLIATLFIVNNFPSLQETTWIIATVLGVITGLTTLLFYRRTDSFTLWIPRGAAEYLYERSKKTKRGIEAFALGLVAGIAELPFIAAPLLFAAMVLRSDTGLSQLGAVTTYTLLACAPLLVVFVLIGSGKRVSQLERWREKNRRFLQHVSGFGLLVLSLYVFSLFYSSQSGISI